MDEQAFSSWVDTYKEAWEKQDADAAVQLFSQDAAYQLTPFHGPMDGTPEIHSYWRRVTSREQHIRFNYTILTVCDNVGVAQWTATFDRPGVAADVEVRGVFVASFGETGLCQRFQLWWHRREHHGTF